MIHVLVHGVLLSAAILLSGPLPHRSDSYHCQRSGMPHTESYLKRSASESVSAESSPGLEWSGTQGDEKQFWKTKKKHESNRTNRAA